MNRSLACLRLVSKSWLAAVTAHPGNLQLDSVENQRDLLRLCKLLPNMGGLEFSIRRMKLNLKTLSTLSGLSHLSLVGVRGKKEELSADISVLPKSLKELHLKSVHMPSECFQSLQCVDLTSLSLHYGRNEEEDVHELLQHLPKLKDLDLISTLPVRICTFLFQGFHWCQALTRLKLSNETLLDPVGENVILLNLTEAHFEDGLMTPDWLNSFNMAAPRLQLLRVQRMICTAALAGEKLNPFTNLRSLVLAPALSGFLQLADESLQSLSFGPYESDPFHRHVEQLARLTNLTRLELIEVNAGDEFTALRQLPIRELLLNNCPEAGEELLVPDALPDLITLHVV